MSIAFLVFVALMLVGFAVGCHDVERQALSKFKLSFGSTFSPYSPEVLLSWKGMDCCLWAGVTCNNVTGYVTSLDFSSNGDGLTAPKLDSALIELKHLNYLDLGQGKVDFQGSQIPGFIGSFKYLSSLDLSYANFGTVLPPQLGNLTRLQQLDLSGLVGGYTDMNDVQILNTINTMQVLTNLPSLTDLELSSCGLVSTPHVYTLLSNLLAGPLSNVFANMSSLVTLYLSNSLLNGSIPLWLRNMRNLEYLDLSFNSFSQVEGGVIMGILKTSSKLYYLLLSDNSLEGELGEPHGNFSNGVTPYLGRLDLYNNRISGRIPASIGNLSALFSLNLSNNSLYGIIPEGLGQLTILTEMDLSLNRLEGVVSDSHLANLSYLGSLRLNNNSLNLKFSDNWSPPFQLDELSLSSCTIGAHLPRWIKSQRHIYKLDLSNTGISGESLHFLCQFNSLAYVDLHQNQFFGTIPDCLSLLSPSLGLIDFSSNKLSGPIPQSIGHLQGLNLLYMNNNSLDGEIPDTLSSLSNLLSMDLGENNLSGRIPDMRRNSLPGLKHLRMKSNKLVGLIPKYMCSLSSLAVLDLGNNNLTGTIPQCFGNLHGMQGMQQSPDSIVASSPEIPGVEDVETVTEGIKGAERQYTSSLQFLVNLDLSCNKLVGSIPESITNLSGVIGFNLSHNRLTGRIPNKIGNMGKLESLDLSNNHLSGTIPSSFTSLYSLSSLNLSNNQLTGRIPTGNQLQTLNDPSIYAGNPGLYGDPLPKKGRPTNDQQQEQQKSEKEDDREKILFYLVIFSGFATGFWGFVGSLLLKKRFRYAWFRVVSNTTDYIYVQIMVRINKLRN